MEVAKIYFIVFGALTIAGGVVGYVKAGSVASIIAGSITGVLLLVAAFLLPEHRAMGLATAFIISLLLAAQFVPKFIRTGRVMPAGMMSILSVIGVIAAIVAWVKSNRVGRIRLRTWRRLVLVIFSALFAAIVYRWISLERLQHAAPLEVIATPTPTPTRTPVITGKLDTAKLFNGITLHSTVDTIPGADATTERAEADSYVLDLKLQARVPSPNKTIEELAEVSPQLPTLLPGLATMLSPNPVSPLYAQLYDAKVRMLRENLARLDSLLSRHNFFDCQTVLQLQHPQTHRKALLLQADMDVDADGSDADRMPISTGTPANFKPSTSYRWPKKTPEPNPYLAATEDGLKRAEAEFALSTTSPARKRDLRNVIAQLRAEIGTLKKYSFLIGATDPFIVVPGAFMHASDPVKPGDYALVIFGNSIYPALVGDVGPNDKAGEASLRIAKEINTLSTPYNRPVSDLKVTYLIFPETADKPFGPPDLEKLQARCETLVKEIGGASVPLHHWENIIPPSPTPSPVSSPLSSPSATASSPSGVSTTASASPSPTFAFPVPSPVATTSTDSTPTPTKSPPQSGARSRSVSRER